MSQLPPGAPVVAYIDVAALRKLQNSPLAAMLGLVGADPKEDRDYQEFVRRHRISTTRAISTQPSSPSGLPALLDTEVAGLGKNQAVAIADGRFDQRKDQGLRAAHRTSWKLEWQKRSIRCPATRRLPPLSVPDANS